MASASVTTESEDKKKPGSGMRNEVTSSFLTELAREEQTAIYNLYMSCDVMLSAPMIKSPIIVFGSYLTMEASCHNIIIILL